MKRSILLYLVLVFVINSYSQQYSKIYSTNISNSFEWIKFEDDSLLCSINKSGFTLFNYTTGKIIFEKTYHQMGSKILKSFVPHLFKVSTPSYNIKTGDIIVSDYNNSIASINMKNGKVNWEENNLSNITDYLSFDDYLIVFENNKPSYPIICLDAVNGNQIWKLDNNEKLFNLRYV